MSRGYWENHLVKGLTEKKDHQLQILDYAWFSTFNIITHIYDIIKRITGNDERTKQTQILRDNFKMTGNTVKSFNDTMNKNFNIECSGYKISSFNKEFMNKFKPLENR